MISRKSFAPVLAEFYCAIKCTVIDNKTASINDKNCSLFIVLAKTAKIIKR